MPRTLSTVEKLVLDGKASLEINTFKKREQAIIRQAQEAGIEFEIAEIVESRGNVYVRMVVVTPETVEEIETVEEVQEIQFTTRKEILETLNFVAITDDFKTQLAETKQTADIKKFIEWMNSNEYFGVYERDNKILFNTPRGADLMYIKKAVEKITGKKMETNNPSRENEQLFSIWKSLDQWSVKDSGEVSNRG